MVAVPALVGVAGVLRGRSAVAGRRAARLAAVCAGLGLYLYGIIAVAVLGAGGPPADPGSTVGHTISDRLGNNVIFDLVIVPLVTATIGWAAAAATARIRPSVATSVVSVPVTVAALAGERSRHPVTTPHEAGPAVGIRSWRRPRGSCCCVPEWQQPCSWPSPAGSGANPRRAYAPLGRPAPGALPRHGRSVPPRPARLAAGADRA